MKKILASLLALFVMSVSAAGGDCRLTFDATSGRPGQLQMPDGTMVSYTAYEHLYFVTHIEDSTYQFMNVYVPDDATQQSPILLRTYVGGYMAAAAASPQSDDATGRALKEGYVVAIPGTRGRNSTVTTSIGETAYTGRAPNAIIDLKAAIRYLRWFDDIMPGNAEHIITDGTSAGGAMSALMGATGNNSAYEPLLQAVGAAPTHDDVFAAVCFCPITDLEHADMAYEWLFNQTESRRKADPAIKAISDELKAQFPTYLESLALHTPDGLPLTADNYLNFIKHEIIRSAQIAKNAGADIPDSIGFTFSKNESFGAPPINGGMPPIAQKTGQQKTPRHGNTTRQGEYITDLDMERYLNYVVSTQPLKTAPAFDTQGVAGQQASGENEEFGDRTGNSVNFTEYGARKAGNTLTKGVVLSVAMLNPMHFIGDPETDVAPHWYIRHGARDRETAFPIPVNLALKLMNAGKDVNFLLAWNRPHSGDYALDELFDWIRDILGN